MLPNLNFNPNFANLAALRGMGGMPHPFGAPLSRPMTYGAPQPAPMTGLPGTPVYSGMPAQTTVPMQQPAMPPQMPQGNLGNLRALMQLFGRQNV